MFRQPATRNAYSSGVVAASAPKPPATMIQPASDPCRSGGCHTAIAFSGAIRHAHTPSADHGASERKCRQRFRIREQQRAGAATASSTDSTRRGP